MEWLNYHHLLYFWLVHREGGVLPAAKKLRLAQPTVSAQIHALETALGEKLFTKVGRRLALTEMGKVVYGYADEIFALGRELVDTVKDRPTGRPLRLTVGVADVIPKLIARRLLQPIQGLKEPIRLICLEDRPERLLAELSLHNLDVVLADAPVPPQSGVRAYSHLLGECGLGLFAAPNLRKQLKGPFPACLQGAPMLLPTEGTALGRTLQSWLSETGLRPRLVGEFQDSALMTAFGEDGMGVFPAPMAIEAELVRVHGTPLLGELPELSMRFYALTGERRLVHPGVVALSQAARQTLFAK